MNVERAKLRGYRNRLALLKDTVPNINELWQDNTKIMEFFESGKAAEFEARLTIKHGKPIDKVRKPLKVETKLTPKLFKDLKAKGINDKIIRADFGLNINQLVAWKKANGLTGLNLQGGKPSDKKKTDKGDVEVAKATVEAKLDGMAELQNVIQEAKIQIEGLEQEKRDALNLVEEHKEQLHASNLKIRQLEASLEQMSGKVSKYIETAEIANKGEKQAITELLNFKEDYRKLEVDYLNKSGELTRVKEMLEKLKYTSQINVWLMKQHVGFVEQADEMAEVFGR
ncbi:hypothetical protein [Psychrobacillus sp. NPDC096389]|uniref:hypothetical protein n=1 Tax=Psychrobacillus sp. NPDC096389 TaxID=3364490 RepID=UPI00382C3C2D